jgi:hypothetical protein
MAECAALRNSLESMIHSHKKSERVKRFGQRRRRFDKVLENIEYVNKELYQSFYARIEPRKTRLDEEEKLATDEVSGISG